MKIVATAILGITTAICGIGWLSNNIASKALVLYIAEKGYIPPTKEETEAYTRKVASKIFKLR